MTISTRHGTPIGARHKAAIAVLALNEEVAGEILAQLDDRELKALAAAVDELDLVPPEALVAVLDELVKAMAGPVSVARTGGAAYVRKLATQSLGADRAQRLFAPLAPASPSPLELVRSARVKSLAELLAEEHPQIAAVVLSQLPARTAAQVLRAMPDERAADLTARVAGIEEIPESAVTEASEALARALAATGGLSSSDQRTEFDGLAFAAALLNELPAEQGDALLDRVSQQDASIATRVREAMFTFEDLLRIEQRQMGPLLRAVQSEVLVMALQTAGEDLRAHLFGALSQRAAQTLKEDLAASKPRRISEVEAAQRQIVEAATRLAAEGQINMPPRGEG
jgi:flagellar motor switch protein FliG